MIGKKDDFMFVLERRKPLPLQKIDRIISRLPPTHPKLPQLREHAAKLQKGYNGERKLDYHLTSLPKSFAILNDVSIFVFNKLTQIDSLIISPHALFIIEVKSYENEVTFNTNLRQFLQHKGDSIQRYKYPVTQVENIQFHLLHWLKQYKVAGLPIYYFIAFSEQSTIINVIGNEDYIKRIVSYVDEIPLRIMNQNEKFEKNQSPNLELRNKLVQTILRNRVVFDKEVLKEFDINKHELLKGVHCPKCGKLAMERKFKKWICSYCSHASKNAHVNALNDWFLLFGDSMTNHQCRNFLKLESRHVAKRILQTSNMKLVNKIWYKMKQENLHSYHSS